MTLSRYHRQMILPGVGEDGQRRLLSSSVLLIGCGALGTVIAETLTRAGVGRLVIVDRDYVEHTNLQRQVLFDERDADEGLPKTVAAGRKLRAINSGIMIQTHVDDVNHTNIATYAGIGTQQQVDVLIDGVDNFETRYVTNDLAVKHGIPYVYGGAVGTVGTTMPILPRTEHGERAWEKAGVATPCLRDIHEEAPLPGAGASGGGAGDTCDTAGVLGPAVSIIAQWQAAEAIKILLQAWDAVNTSMRHLDIWHNTVRDFNVANAYDPQRGHVSRAKGFEFLAGGQATQTTTICGRNSVQIRPKETRPLDLPRIARGLASLGVIKLNPYVLRITLDGSVNGDGEPYAMTLFEDGRAMIHGTKKPAEAKAIYARLLGG